MKNHNENEINLEDQVLFIKNHINKDKISTRISKDDYLSKLYDNMKFTKHHFFLILSIFLIRSIEGTEILSLSITSEMIEKNFTLPQNSSSYINVIILSGNFIGCVISLLISNKFPRKFFIKTGVAFIIFFGILSLLQHKILLFVICRHFVNVGIGLLYAGSVSLVTESINSNYRGFVLNLILVSGSVGEIFISIFLGTLVNLENPHELSRIFLLAITPIIIGAAFIPFYEDSIVYYVDTKNYSEAFKICKNYLSNFEETQENFSNIMESNDINYENEITRIQEEDKKDSSFFNYSAIMVFALFNSFLVQGIRYILPKTLTHFYHLKLYNLKEEHFKAGYSHNAAVVSAELQISSTLSAFISFLTGILIENSFFKRLRLLRIGIFLCTILSFLAYFLRNKIDVFACSLKSLITLQDQILDIYSSETFDTKRRIMLLSTYNIIQSISSFMSPYVNDLITNYWFRLNYLIFFIILCFLFLLSFGLGKEKIKKILI